MPSSGIAHRQMMILYIPAYQVSKDRFIVLAIFQIFEKGRNGCRNAADKHKQACA